MLDNVLLVDGGALREAELRALLGRGRCPARNPDQNIADLKAQIAACSARRRTGARLSPAIGGRLSCAPIWGMCRPCRGDAVRGVHRPAGRRRLRLRDGQRCADPRWRSASISRGRHARFRFRRHQRPAARTISTRRLRSSAPRCSMCSARWSTSDLPLNDGCLRAVTIIVPEGSMLNPRHPAAVVAGNVETEPGDLRRAAWRAGRVARRAGDDEQLHLRQRPLPILRDDRRRLGRRPGLRRQPPRCRRI